jgi:DNA-binding NarL/FixJ family response regulator
MNRIGIVDKNDLFRSSLKSYVDNIKSCQVNIDCSDVKELEIRLFPGMVNILIIEIYKFTDDEWNCLKKLVHNFPEVKILILSNDISKEKVMKLIEIGVSGFYSKEVCPELLKNVILEIATTKNTFDIKLGAIVRERIMTAHFFNSSNKEILANDFSDREIEILNLICQEMTSPQISEALNLSVRTIEAHRRRMIDKCDKKNIVGVILHALSLNIPLMNNLEINSAS